MSLVHFQNAGTTIRSLLGYFGFCACSSSSVSSHPGQLVARKHIFLFQVDEVPKKGSAAERSSLNDNNDNNNNSNNGYYVYNSYIYMYICINK